MFVETKNLNAKASAQFLALQKLSFNILQPSTSGLRDGKAEVVKT